MKYQEEYHKNLPHFISLGGGVQSSTMALMATKGLLTPMPKAAIFADTQNEPPSVYKWIEWLIPKLAFPTYRVTNGKLSENELIIKQNQTHPDRKYMKTKIPMFTDKGPLLKTGKLGRKCTVDYKIVPIHKEIRKIEGLSRIPAWFPPMVVQWIGFSTDEWTRAKDSRIFWIVNRHPLLEIGMSRENCLNWWKSQGLPQPPRSACVFCPLHKNYEWQRIKTEEPKEFEFVINLEKQIHENFKIQNRLKYMPYLHRSCKPIGGIDFENPEESQREAECDQGNCFT